MSMCFNRLVELTEEKIGQGRSKDIFGEDWKILYKIIEKEEDNLTEEMFIEGLSRCKFKNPEKVGLISLFCPIVYMNLVDRTLKKGYKEFYKFCLCSWYSLSCITLIDVLIGEKVRSALLYFTILCFLFISFCFRNWSKDWNKLELIYNTLDVDGKLDRVIKKREDL